MVTSTHENGFSKVLSVADRESTLSWEHTLCLNPWIFKQGKVDINGRHSIIAVLLQSTTCKSGSAGIADIFHRDSSSP